MSKRKANPTFLKPTIDFSLCVSVSKAVPAALKLAKSFANYLSGRDFAGT